jgi:UDP-N-acetylmuramate--alanine ligase
MGSSLSDFNRIFFIGIAGTGMSALAQYLNGTGKIVTGSDRYFKDGEDNQTRALLEKEGIQCFPQDGRGISSDVDLVVVSTAVEEDVHEVIQARSLKIPIIQRSALLSLIIESKRTIAVGGTSGKSTTSAMIFSILEYAGMSPSIISGAGLVSIMEEGRIGNAKVGTGQWLIVEADESDGSITRYHPEIGVLLNIDKDHKEVTELVKLFTQFRDQSRSFVVNRSHPLAALLSKDALNDFGFDTVSGVRYVAADLNASGMEIRFRVENVPFLLRCPGKHNVENALAAIAVAGIAGVDLKTCSAALEGYRGIYRRHQLIGRHKGIWLIDDYAHNPVKCAASIQACQALSPKVIAWFQPHGYGPTRFLRKEFADEIAGILRDQDEIWMSEIFYAGGTAVKDISAEDLIGDIRAKGKKAFFLLQREGLVHALQSHFTEDCVLLLMGARDPGLELFAQQVWEELQTMA